MRGSPCPPSLKLAASMGRVFLSYVPTLPATHLWTPTVPETRIRFPDQLFDDAPPTTLRGECAAIPFSSGLRIPHFRSCFWPFRLCKNIHPLGCNQTSFFSGRVIGFEPLRGSDFETGRRTTGGSEISWHSAKLSQEASSNFCVNVLVDCACWDSGDLS